MKLFLIAAIGKRGELGKDNQLLWDLPQELRFFRQLTKKRPVIMGRKTFQSIGRLLPQRRNIVLSSDFHFSGLEVYPDVATVLTQVADEERVFVIGGAQIYQLFLPLATGIYLTEIDQSFGEADTFFPPIDLGQYRRKVLGYQRERGLSYRFCLYTKQ